MTARDRRAHWQDVYRSKDSTALSWYRPHLETSLALIEATGVHHDARILDVGGGTSTLAEDLLHRGFTAISVLDVSASALERARQRLEEGAAPVAWIAADVLDEPLPASAFDIWHDRAVLHFLVDEADRRAYVRQLCHAVDEDGHVIIATFAPGGPDRCSDLPVRQYDAAGVQQLLGEEFELRQALPESHVTPSGAVQPFTYCWLQRGAR